jgi:hypothetical protein
MKAAIGAVFGLVAWGIATPAPAAPMRVLDAYDEPVVITGDILARYAAGNPPDPLKLPFVPRVRSAFARADIVADPITGTNEVRLGPYTIAPTRMEDDKRGEVIVRLENAGIKATVTLAFDRTSGDWLITDIRYGSGETLRKLLQIPTPR